MLLEIPRGESRWTLLREPLAMAAATTLVLGAFYGGSLAAGHTLCPFYLLTGHPCPGCGGSRAAYALLTGHPLQALSYNAYALVVVGWGVALWLLWIARRARGERASYYTGPRWLAWTLLGGTVLWTLFRWTPFYPGVHL